MIVRRTIRDGSGVSESIGFILMFTIVIAGIGLVTLYGFPLLLQQQSGADEKIMEKNMIVLQNDFKSIVYKTIPYKETSMKIASGALSVNNAMTTGLPAFAIWDGGVIDKYYPTGDLSYRSTQLQEEISLQNGAVVKRNTIGSSGSAMLAQPRWFYDADTQTLVINIVTVNSSSTMGREGIGTVQMELGQPPNYPTEYNYFTGLNSPINVAYTTDATQDYHTAWENYFEQTMNMACDPWESVAPLTLTCHTTADTPVSTLVIKRTDIIIRSI
ncbi:MAG: hypothetical protein WCB46_05455 [Methanoregula sp.]